MIFKCEMFMYGNWLVKKIFVAFILCRITTTRFFPHIELCTEFRKYFYSQHERRVCCQHNKLLKTTLRSLSPCLPESLTWNCQHSIMTGIFMAPGNTLKCWLPAALCYGALISMNEAITEDWLHREQVLFSKIHCLWRS